MADEMASYDAHSGGQGSLGELKLRWLRLRKQLFFVSLVAPSVVFVLGFLVIPLWRMFLLSFGSAESISVTYDLESLDQYRRVFSSTAYQRVILNTFWISFLTTVGCVIAGYPTAYVLATVSDRVRKALLAVLVLTMWTSILIRTFAWRVILGRRGLVNETLEWIGAIDDPLHLVFNRTGTLVGMIHILLPLLVLPVFAVMRGIPKEYMLAAETLGAGPLRAWWRVYLPLSLPGVGAGALLVFILSLGFFITPALLGGASDRMISNMIALQIGELNNWEFASALAFLLLTVTLALYFLYARFMSFEQLYRAR